MSSILSPPLRFHFRVGSPCDLCTTIFEVNGTLEWVGFFSNYQLNENNLRSFVCLQCFSTLRNKGSFAIGLYICCLGLDFWLLTRHAYICITLKSISVPLLLLIVVLFWFWSQIVLRSGECVKLEVDWQPHGDVWFKSPLLVLLLTFEQWKQRRHFDYRRKRRR